MLWKKSWQPEAMLLLAGGVVFSFFAGTLTVELLHKSGMAGFKSLSDLGSVLLETLCFHGAALALTVPFLKLHGVSLREVLGLDQPGIKRCLLLATGVLLLMLPAMFGLKFISDGLLQKINWHPEAQRPVEIFLNTKSVWLKTYLVLFAVVIAPAAEEFIFRGLLFSAAKKMGWPVFGWVGVSLLFALIHNSAAVFVPLFAFALALTWLYEKTEGLLAPIVAHSFFNALNLALLVLLERTGYHHA